MRHIAEVIRPSVPHESWLHDRPSFHCGNGNPFVPCSVVPLSLIGGAHSALSTISGYGQDGFPCLTNLRRRSSLQPHLTSVKSQFRPLERINALDT